MATVAEAYLIILLYIINKAPSLYKLLLRKVVSYNFASQQDSCDIDSF